MKMNKKNKPERRKNVQQSIIKAEDDTMSPWKMKKSEESWERQMKKRKEIE